MPLRPTASRFESLPATPFYFALVLAGFATSLLGPILPALSAQWSLSDTQGGWLFAAQFLASTCGSILSSYSPRRSVALGFASIAAGVALLATGHYGAALLAFALIGVGLGAAVSATNLIFGTEYPERRGALLTRVNLCWGAGAVLAPQLAALAEHEDSLKVFLLLLALCAFVMFAAFSPLLRKGRDVLPPGDSFDCVCAVQHNAVSLCGRGDVGGGMDCDVCAPAGRAERGAGEPVGFRLLDCGGGGTRAGGLAAAGVC
jgi:MFS transporter, FHS family, glucose/mannose:H+ symporter